MCLMEPRGEEIASYEGEMLLDQPVYCYLRVLQALAMITGTRHYSNVPERRVL